MGHDDRGDNRGDDRGDDRGDAPRDEVVAVLDEWLRLRVPADTAPLVLKLRARVGELFEAMVARPG